MNLLNRRKEEKLFVALKTIHDNGSNSLRPRIARGEVLQARPPRQTER